VGPPQVACGGHLDINYVVENFLPEMPLQPAIFESLFRRQRRQLISD
jgi:hypothetical protein